VQLGFENKNKAITAAVLGVIAVLAFAYFVVPFFTESSTPASSAQAAAPALAPRTQGRGAAKLGKKPRTENLDPTLRLDLLAASEKTLYEGTDRNIFVSHSEDVKIPPVIGKANTDSATATPQYITPTPPAAPPIPLKFYGFASSPGEPKKIFLRLGEDVFVAGEGEIVDRRYKVIRISATSVEIQDVVNSGPPQSIPLTQG
jgi:hypothetical protein